eukprot:CAMPEP_0115091456 /NCGR_PEP_ID=MMETSP0227-20121206/26121_1 /TAXON_ID=89957 /ORGANISM="Polarella glacialis, Strain CCMP 1383" /LENGTH=173 /DNA_ID=CAMNT_0002482967 /DNA_START=75 /DNA_END=596 /DNA_ORIENTATION=-
MASIIRTAFRGAPRMAQCQARLPLARTFRHGRLATPIFQPALSFRAFSEVRYCETHEWFKIESSDAATLGISDFAQGALGEVVYCELPEVGAKFKAKATICTLESVKAVGEVYAPVDCEVTAVNDKLSDEPALVNSSPQEDGWLVKVKYTGDVSGLMDGAAYKKHMESEANEH